MMFLGQTVGKDTPYSMYWTDAQADLSLRWAHGHFCLSCSGSFGFVSVLENRKSTDEEIVDKYCFYVRYEIPERPGGGDWSDEYLARIRKFPCLLWTSTVSTSDMRSQRRQWVPGWGLARIRKFLCLLYNSSIYAL